MVATFLSLASELHEMIFAELTSYADALRSLLICRTLYPEAERTMYTTIALGTDDIGARGVLMRLAQAPHIAHHVKCLQLPPELDPHLIDASFIPWPTIFESLINLDRLEISHPEHLEYLLQMNHHRFRLRTLSVDSKVTAGRNGMAHLASFLLVQPTLERLVIMDDDAFFPEDLASDPKAFLPALNGLMGGDVLVHQLIPGRRVTWARVCLSNAVTPESTSGGEELRNFVIEDVKLLALFPCSYSGLQYLRCAVDWPFQLSLLPNWEQLVNLLEISFILGNEDSTDDDDELDFAADYCTPLFSMLFDFLPTLRTVHIFEFMPSEGVAGHAFVKKRAEPEPRLIEWRADYWSF